MVTELSPEEVESRLEELQVVDIRGPRRFAEGHIPGAINVPMAELPARIEAIDWEETIVCVCPIGQSSIQAARLIESYEGVPEGATVASMEGGYRDWDGDLDTEDGSGRSG